jgi:tetratricopeptide (TPR) repeat protein
MGHLALHVLRETEVKGTIKHMLNQKGRANAALALLLLASFAIACSQLKNLGNKGGGEVNKLVQEAKDDLDAVDKIQDENEDRVSKINQAENANDAAEVKKQLNEAIEAIDKGLERGNDAVDKIDRASKIETDPTYKEYLALKAQAFRKQVDAFKKLREAAVIERDNFGKGGDVEKKAIADFRKAYADYKKLLNEAKELHRKADEIARKNPDKIKG